MAKSLIYQILKCCLLGWLWGFSALTASAQWTTQSLTLRPGWNAIHLDVAPEPTDCDVVFGNLPVESVWMWNRQFSSVQFLQNPDELLPGQPDWLVYYPPSSPSRVSANLFSLMGGRSFLVKVSASAASFNWVIKGKTIARRRTWLSDSWNFVGFDLSPGAVVSPGTLFAGSVAHNAQAVYRLDSATGKWKAASLASDVLSPGEAFWVYTKGQSAFQGLLEASVDGDDSGLHFGRLLVEQRLHIRNWSAINRSFSIKLLPSENPPSGSIPPLAGPVLLSYYRLNVSPTRNEFGWVPLPNVIQTPPLAPGAEWVFRLAVRRSDMVSQGSSGSGSSASYQSMLEISDSTGYRQRLPVTSDGLQSGQRSVLSLADATSGTEVRAGLWTGEAVIRAVSQPSNASTPDQPVAVASPFHLRLLVHVDSAGKARLLSKVLQMWKEAETNALTGEIAVPAHFVLLTDESLASRFQGATLHEGKLVARRLKSTAFGFSIPIPFAGVGHFGDPGATYSVAVPLSYDDPLNPFLHRFHPDHNNLDERFEKKLPEGQESMTVQRSIQLQFTAEDPESLSVAGQGDNQLVGIYRESLTGLHRRTLFLSGSFRLTFASRVATLNDGLSN